MLDSSCSNRTNLRKTQIEKKKNLLLRHRLFHLSFSDTKIDSNVAGRHGPTLNKQTLRTKSPGKSKQIYIKTRKYNVQIAKTRKRLISTCTRADRAEWRQISSFPPTDLLQTAKTQCRQHRNQSSPTRTCKTHAASSDV
jgi:hypothetical protein